MKRFVAVIAVIAVAVALLYYATLAGADTECEACMRFEGRAGCRSAAAAGRDEAERMAIATACAVVANGVTATIRCQGQEPAKISCRAR